MQIITLFTNRELLILFDVNLFLSLLQKTNISITKILKLFLIHDTNFVHEFENSDRVA